MYVADDRLEPGGSPAGFTTGYFGILMRISNMQTQLKMLVGVAVFATLALAGMLGIFTFRRHPRLFRRMDTAPLGLSPLLPLRRWRRVGR